MKSFFIILKFELQSFLKNKAFMRLTLALIVLLGIVISSPRFLPLFEGMISGEEEDKQKIAVASAYDMEDVYMDALSQSLALADIEVEATKLSLDELKVAVENQEITRAIYMNSPTDYIEIVGDVELYDQVSVIMHESIASIYQMQHATKLGLSPQEGQELLYPTIVSELIQMGVNQEENFLYTYIMIFLLYMAVIIFGQQVVSNIVLEKTSRTMEVLVTSAKPTTFIFAKVIGTGIAGLLQMAALLCSVYLFYNMNSVYWKDNAIVNSLFNIPSYLIVYLLIFFVLGFFIYAFMFGAAGSLASKLEDLNALITPVMLLFIASFFISVYGLMNGEIDGGLMKVASFVPFTSPMSMFIRIAMSEVPMIEIMLSIVILILTTGIIGLIAAKIYRYGVFFYGNKPSLLKVCKVMFSQTKRR